MAKIEGYVVRYAIPGMNGYKFLPGCFFLDHRKGNWIPVMTSFTRDDQKEKVGQAKVEFREDGLYVYCDVPDDEFVRNLHPMSFGMYGNLARTQHGNEYYNICLRYITLEGEQIATSKIERIEIDGQRQNMEEWNKSGKPAKIIAVDFDGTLCENAWPNIGDERWDVINKLKDEKDGGAKVILWTCREGERLQEAANWCEEHGIVLDAVNENLPEIIESFGGDSRKIFANEYWDDKSVEI